MGTIMHCGDDRSCRFYADKLFISLIVELVIMARKTTSPVTVLGHNAGIHNIGIKYGQ